MKMREVVIKVSEEKYNAIMNYQKEWDEWALNAIKHGTLLPKGHGKLIDAKEYENSIRKHYFDNHTVIRCTEIALYAATPVIEADTEDEEKEAKSKNIKKREGFEL